MLGLETANNKKKNRYIFIGRENGDTNQGREENFEKKIPKKKKGIKFSNVKWLFLNFNFLGL